MEQERLVKLISIKSRELTSLVLTPKVTLLDKEVYQKSCELDELVVQYMNVRKKERKTP